MYSVNPLVLLVRFIFLALDNINCLLSGTKRLLFFEAAYQELMESPLNGWRDDGGFSDVDVDAVNLTKYPALAQIPFYSADMEPGKPAAVPMNKKARTVDLWACALTEAAKMDEGEPNSSHISLQFSHE